MRAVVVYGLSFAAFVTGLGLLAFVLMGEDRSEPYALLTEEEYASLDRSAVETRAMTFVKRDGPDIVVHSPRQAADLRSPLDFDVEFKPNGAEPDLKTLKLEYDLGIFWKDVTERIAGKARIAGNRIVSRGAKLPAGQHRLRMTIHDARGRATVTEIRFRVVD